jgi:hypothetical protein
MPGSVATRERVQITDLASVGLQIVRWLDGAATPVADADDRRASRMGKEHT